MADPPTAAEMLAATRVLRGCWVHAPASCAAAGAAGAADALTRALEFAGAPPPPPRDSPSDLLQRALEQWHLDRESLDDDSKRNADGLSASDRHAPPLKVAFPGGARFTGRRRRPRGGVHRVGRGRSRDRVRPAVAGFGAMRDFGSAVVPHGARRRVLRRVRGAGGRARRGGVPAPVARRGQRRGAGRAGAAVHRLPGRAHPARPAGAPRRGPPGGPGLAARAEATLEATIGAETTAEILEAAEDLHDIFAHEGDEGELWSENGDAGLGVRRLAVRVSPRRPASREGSVRRGSARSEG